MKYRKKPVVVEAIQFLGYRNIDECIRFLEEKSISKFDIYPGGDIVIYTLEGRMHAEPGSWIIIGVEKEAYPCRNDIFCKTYETEDGEEVCGTT